MTIYERLVAFFNNPTEDENPIIETVKEVVNPSKVKVGIVGDLEVVIDEERILREARKSAVKSKVGGEVDKLLPVDYEDDPYSHSESGYDVRNQLANLIIKGEISIVYKGVDK